MASKEADPIEIDVAAANLGDVRDPYPAYAEARRTTPVAKTWHIMNDVYMVYGYDDVHRVLNDGDTFSSAINGRVMRPFLGRTLIEMDGQHHRVHRRLISHAFRPRVVTGWEEDLIRPVAHQLVDTFASRGRAELVKEYAWLLPVRVIAKIVGVPEEDDGMWLRHAIELERTVLDFPAAIAASNDLKRYFGPMVEERRREPREDLITDLVAAEMDGVRLDDDLIQSFLRLLVPAGAGTTYRLIGNLLLALLRDPDQLAAVRADRSLLPAAVEEALRWEAPVQFAGREAVKDVEIGGVEIPVGSPVTTNLASANHDETKYDDPERFDVFRRGPPPHVAFGEGAHFCLGSFLARMEAKVALDVILDRLPDLRLDPGAEEPYVVGLAFRSPTAVPVAFKEA